MEKLLETTVDRCVGPPVLNVESLTNLTAVNIATYVEDAVQWDDFVRMSSGWTIFHLYRWKSLIETVFSHECPYLVAYDDAGSIAGVLPLVRVRSRLFGHYLVSMPFVNYGGPLGSDFAIRSLTDAATAMADRDQVKLLELRSRTSLPVELIASHRKITVVLDLPSTPEALRKQIGSKLRSQVNRPIKEGVTVRFGRDQVDPFFEVLSTHMRDLGTPTQSRKFFSAIADSFKEDAWFACAWHEGHPISGGAGFRWGDEFEMTWASSLRAYNRFSPNMLLYWSFMERAIAEGVARFNFGRCSVDSGTHKFKRQWGSRDEQLWWYQWSKAAGMKTPSPDDGAYAWGPRLWRHLPVRVATALGPHIVRFIP